MAQVETQQMLLLWKTTSETLALSLSLGASRRVLSESFLLAINVFDAYKEPLLSAFAAISALPDVQCVWNAGMLQYRWKSKSGKPRRLIHVYFLDFVRDYLDDLSGTT
jgi:hypothetical protein